MVSIRAPLNRKRGADALASQFPIGEGRKTVTEINVLPRNDLSCFIAEFDK